MTRTDYIAHVEHLRNAVANIIAYDLAVEKAQGAAMLSTIEEDRKKKTYKMLQDLHTRLYEDGAVSERQRREAMLNGDMEQGEFSLAFLTSGESRDIKQALDAFAATTERMVKHANGTESDDE